LANQGSFQSMSVSNAYIADLLSLADEDSSTELECEDCGNATGSKPGTGGRLMF